MLRGKGMRYSRPQTALQDCFCGYWNEFLLVSCKIIIMSQDRLIKLACQECKRINYWTGKNKKKVERKIELKKLCKWCGGHRVHKEMKK